MIIRIEWSPYKKAMYIANETDGTHILLDRNGTYEIRDGNFTSCDLAPMAVQERFDEYDPISMIEEAGLNVDFRVAKLGIGEEPLADFIPYTPDLEVNGTCWNLWMDELHEQYHPNR